MLATNNRQQPLLSTAGKSWIGHTEAAAGAIGLIHALVGLQSRSAQALMHLTAVNPYLEAALRPQQHQQGSPAAAWALPRQAAGLPVGGSSRMTRSSSLSSSMLGMTSAAELTTGVSSFAFQVGATSAHWSYATPCSLHCTSQLLSLFQ